MFDDLLVGGLTAYSSEDSASSPELTIIGNDSLKEIKNFAVTKGVPLYHCYQEFSDGTLYGVSVSNYSDVKVYGSITNYPDVKVYGSITSESRRLFYIGSYLVYDGSSVSLYHVYSE